MKSWTTCFDSDFCVIFNITLSDVDPHLKPRRRATDIADKGLGVGNAGVTEHTEKERRLLLTKEDIFKK